MHQASYISCHASASYISCHASASDISCHTSAVMHQLSCIYVREDMRHGMFVEGLQEVVVSTADATYALFKRGSQNRRVGQTAMNMESSRSHSVFTIVVETQRRDDAGVMKRRTSRFNLVDLAGSERQKHSEAQGVRLKEAGSINKSLSALGNVIKALVDIAEGKVRHVPYRDSKLTFLLSDSLGGNSKCTLLAAVSPAERNVDETMSTLKFAQRAKLMHNEAVVNELMMGNPAVMGEEIRRLRLEIAELRANATAGVPGQPLLPPSPSPAPMSEHELTVCCILLCLTIVYPWFDRQILHDLHDWPDFHACLDLHDWHDSHDWCCVVPQGLKMVVKLRDGRIKRVEAQGRCDGQCARGEDAAAVEELSQEVEVLRRMVERNPDAIRFQLEVDVCKARISELEEQLQTGTSEGDKVAALERLNNALREELKEAFDENEALRGKEEEGRREREELRAKLVGMEEHVKKVAAVAEQYRMEVNNTRQLQRSVNDRKHEFDEARVRYGVAEAKVGKLLQQLAATQQAESVLKVEAAEHHAQSAALARDLQTCRAELARNVAEGERSAADAAQLRADLEAVRKQVEGLVKEKVKAEGQAAEAAAAGKEKERAHEEQRKALEEAMEEMRRAQKEMEDAGRQKVRELEEQKRVLEEEHEGMRRKLLEMEDAGKEKEGALEEQKSALEEELEGIKRKQQEMEDAVRENVKELEEQKRMLEEELEGMKGMQVELEEKVQALEKERELLWAAAEKSGADGDADGADGAGGSDAAKKRSELGERIAKLEEELKTERGRVIDLAEKVGDRDGLLEAACERQRRAEEAAERARREAEEFAAGGHKLQQVNLALEEQLCSALESLQEAKERVERLEQERVGLLEEAIMLEKETEEEQQQKEQEEEEQKQQEQEERHSGGGSGSKRRWQETVKGDEEAVEAGGEEGVLSPMTLCLTELRDVTNRASPSRVADKGSSAADAAGKDADARGGATGSGPSRIRLGTAADMPTLPASASANAFLANRWTLPFAGDNVSASADSDSDLLRYAVTGAAGGLAGGEVTTHGALGRRLEKKKRRRSAPVSQAEAQAEKLRLMEVQVRHMVKQLAAAHAQVKSLSGRMQKAGPLMVRMRDVVQQLRAKGQALELALLHTLEREAERDQAEEDEKEEVGLMYLGLEEQRDRLREERDAYLKQLMVVGPRNAVLCEEFSAVKARLEAAREEMGQMGEERARLRSKLARLSRKLEQQVTGRTAAGGGLESKVRVEHAVDGEKGEDGVKTESRAEVEVAADVEDVDEELMADVDEALAVVREHVGEVESRNRQLAEQVRALEQQCERLQAEAEGVGSRKTRAVRAVVKSEKEERQEGGLEGAGKRVDGQQECEKKGDGHKREEHQGQAHEQEQQRLVGQVEELLARLAAAEEQTKGTMGRAALAEQRCSEMHARVAAVVARERALQKLLVSPLLRDAGAGDGGVGGSGVVGRGMMGAVSGDEIVEGWKARWRQLEQEQGELDLHLNQNRVGDQEGKDGQEHAEQECGQGGVECGAEAGNMGADVGQEQRRMQVEEVRGVLAQVVLVESLLAVVLCRAGLAGLSSRMETKLLGSNLGSGEMVGAGGIEGEGGSLGEGGSGAGAGKGEGEPGGVDGKENAGVSGSEEEERTGQGRAEQGVGTEQVEEVLNALQRQRVLLLGFLGVKAEKSSKPEQNEQERNLANEEVERAIASPSDGQALPFPALVSKQVRIAQQVVRAGFDALMANDDTCWLRGSVLRGVYALRKLVEEVEGKVGAWEAQWGELEQSFQQQNREFLEVGRALQHVQGEKRAVEGAVRERAEEEAGRREVVERTVRVAAEAVEVEKELEEKQQQVAVAAVGNAAACSGQGSELSSRLEKEVEWLQQVKDAKEREVVGLMKRVTEMELQGRAQWEQAVRRQEAAAKQVEGLLEQLRAAQQQLGGKSGEVEKLVWMVEQLKEEVKAKDDQITSLHVQLAAATKAVALNSPLRPRQPAAAAAADRGESAPASDPRQQRPSDSAQGSRRVRQRLGGVLSAIHSMGAIRDGTRSPFGFRGVGAGNEGAAAAAASGGAVHASTTAGCSGRGTAASVSCGTGGGEGEEFYTPMTNLPFSPESAEYSGGGVDASGGGLDGGAGGSVKGSRGKGSGWGVGHGGVGGGSAKMRGWGSGVGKCVGSDENAPLIPYGPQSDCSRVLSFSGDGGVASAPLHTPPVAGSASKVTVRTAFDAPAPFSQLSGRWQQDRPLSGEGTPRSIRRGPVLSPRFRALSFFDATFSRYSASRSSSSKSWSEPRLLAMCAKWLLKSEPETWSWDDQVAKKLEPWDGVRNHQAANNMKAMKTGDLAFFYHSGKERRVMGIVQICKEYYPDPSDKSEKFGMVDVETVEAFPSPVTLRAIKEDLRLSHIALVRQSRLSVMPVDEAAWDIIKDLGLRASDISEKGDEEEMEGGEEGREAGRGDKRGKGGKEVSEGQESVQDPPEAPQPPAPPVPPAPPAPPMPPTPPAPPVPLSPPCQMAPHIDNHPLLTLLLPSAFDEYLSEPDYDKGPDVDVPAPAPAPRWGQPEDFTWDESAVGADDDVQDAEEDWRAEGDAGAEGGTEADTEAATEAGTAEDVFPEGAPGGDDDDGVEYWHKPNDHKRQAYIAAEKLKWVAQLDVAVSVRALARESGIHRKCLANWKRAADFLKEAHSARKRMHGRGRALWYRLMEIKVYERLLDWRCKGTAVSIGRMQEWSRESMKILYPLVKWKGSQRWTDRFHVAEQCKKFWQFVRDKRRERGIETMWIINADQTPLWLEMPATTTVDQTGVRNALHGSEDGLAMAHRRSQLTAELDVDDSIIADGFFGNNGQEPESDEKE
ncbi:unnamed protein product [Closterium sp. NIES-54]